MTDNSMDTSYQLTRQKIIFTGDPAVGKTSIINTIMGQKFVNEYEPSIGVDFFSKTIRYKGKLIKLQIWDSAGQEKFKSLIPNYIRGSSLVFLVYDVTNKETFDHLNNWIEFINNIENSNIVIVGNKIDLNESREVSKEEGEKFCKESNYDFYEVSAKEDNNIDKMLFGSVAGLPFFTGINQEGGESKENIRDNLLQENIDTFRLQNNNNYNSNQNIAQNLNVIRGSENDNKIGGESGAPSDTDKNAHNVGLINPPLKKKKICCF